MGEEPDVDEALVRAIEEGSDAIAIPMELLVEDEDAPAASEEEATRSLYSQILRMTVSERVKLALRGNKNARLILIRDATKLIRRFVLANPRITEAEVVTIARNRSADEEMLRVISQRREWMRNYQVRLALAGNPKTPLPIALRQVGTLGERDLRMMAKSRNVPETVAAQARRLVLTMGK